MKKLIIILAVVAVVLLVPPFFIGSQVEAQFNQQLAELQKHPNYEFKLTEYNKGWLSSSAVVDISLKMGPVDNAEIDGPLSISVKQDMQHGPLLWTADSLGIGLFDAKLDFILPKDMQEELDKIEQIDDETLSITSRTSLNTDTTSNLVLKPFTFSKDGVDLEVKGAQGSFSYTAEGHITSSGSWHGMRVVEADATNFSFADMSFSMDQQLVSGKLFSPQALFAGDASMTIATIEASGNTPAESVSVQDINVKMNSDIEQDLADVKVLLNIKSVAAIQQTFTNFVYDFSMENLDTKVLLELNEAVAEAQSDVNNPMAVAVAMQTILPKLIEKNPLIKINKLGVTTAQGDIDSSLNIAFNQDVYQAENPMTMMLALDAHAAGHGPEAFFAAFGLSPMIDQFVTQNQLVRDGDNLKFEFTFKNGQPLLNGQPMPLGGF